MDRHVGIFGHRGDVFRRYVYGLCRLPHRLSASVRQRQQSPRHLARSHQHSGADLQQFHYGPRRAQRAAERAQTADDLSRAHHRSRRGVSGNKIHRILFQIRRASCARQRLSLRGNLTGTPGRDIFFFLLCDDRNARRAHDHRHRAVNRLNCHGITRSVLRGVSYSRGTSGPLLAFCRHCLDISLSLALSFGAPFMNSNHVLSVRLYAVIFLALVALTLTTTGVAFIDLGGGFNVTVALTIAVVKALLVILFFMHVRYSDRLTWVFVGAGFFWLAIMMALTFGDFLTRGSG